MAHVLNLGGKKREFRYSMHSFKRMSERYGTPMAAFEKLNEVRTGDRWQQLQALLNPEIVDLIIFLVWSGLSTFDDKITEKELERMITDENLLEVVVAITSIFRKDTRAGEPGAVENPPEA
jgi:hypothetical protein